MHRDLKHQLIIWKDSPLRSPLILRGARQVGKSWLIENFGNEYFDQCITINFEQRPEAKLCFETLLPEKIIIAIELLFNCRIIPGKTLIFFDEIQECPKAITALRYFKEQLASLHIIAAGSLLEFALHDEKFSMPVGRIQFLYMYPLSFGEFLSALGRDNLRKYLKNVTLNTPPQSVIHEELLRLTKEYLALGGMPAVLAAYFQTKSLQQTQQVQTDILATYRNDFGKYASKAKHRILSLLFEKSPGIIANWFKYSKIDPDAAPRDLRQALQQLCYAGLLYQVHHTSATGLPLISTQNEKKFKLLFLDVGLVKRATLLEMALLFQEDLMLVNQGALAEQFVGQELLSYSNAHEKAHLFFWAREQKSSSAEIDFLITLGSQIVPIEVKAGTTGRLKSLKLFMDEKNIPLGVRVSAAPLSLENKILSIPFYLLAELPRLYSEVRKKEEPL